MTKTKRRACLLSKKFGRLTPLAVFEQTGQKEPRLLCLCDCGIVKSFFKASLRSGSTRSCGCLRNEITAKTNTIHGAARGYRRTSEYHSWGAMIQRCSNPKNNRFRYYGARGIQVCVRWRESFNHFLADMGVKPSSGMSIERINNDGNYEPGNCHWATAIEQANNRRKRNI